MPLPTPTIHPANTAFWRWLKAGIALGAGWLAITTAGRALVGAWDSSDFPELLLVKVEALPLIFPLHMATGGLALLLVPLATLPRVEPLGAGKAPSAITTRSIQPLSCDSEPTRRSAADFFPSWRRWIALRAIV